MPPRNGQGLLLALAAFAACSHSRRLRTRTIYSEPREADFTPLMRAMVVEEMARLLVAEPHLNSKQRKKKARKAVWEAAHAKNTN